MSDDGAKQQAIPDGQAAVGPVGAPSRAGSDSVYPSPNFSPLYEFLSNPWLMWALDDRGAQMIEREKK